MACEHPGYVFLVLRHESRRGRELKIGQKPTNTKLSIILSVSALHRFWKKITEA
jgi:hypothetical protein